MAALKVLGVGMSVSTRQVVESLLASVVPHTLPTSRKWVDRFGEEDLEMWDVVLLDVAASGGDQKRLAADPSLLWRSRIVVDLRSCRADVLWRVVREQTMTPLVVGDGDIDADARSGLERLLYADPLREALAPVLDVTCSDSQEAFLLMVLPRACRVGPNRIARTIFESPRTLRRRCAELELCPPRSLRRISRVSLAMAWAARAGGRLDGAHLVAGYSEPSAFRRATRAAFGVNPNDLMREWKDPVALADRFRTALRRS